LVNGFGEVRARPEGSRLEASRADSGDGALREVPPPHQLEGMGERCKLPQRGPGGAPAAKGFSRILNTPDDLSGQQDDGPRRFYFFGFLAEW